MSKLSIAILSVVLLTLISTGCAADKQITVTMGKGILMDKVGDYTEAQPGNTYLVLPLQFENQGYDSLDYNPYYCKVTVDNVQYNDAFIGYSLAQLG